MCVCVCVYVCGDLVDNTLHWLIDTLQAAEDAGERVLMLRHIPNASRSVPEPLARTYTQKAIAYAHTRIHPTYRHRHHAHFHRDSRGAHACICVVGGEDGPSLIQRGACRCNTAWSLNYHTIMVRFESTIIAMFSGHSHSDFFELYYRDAARTQAAVVNYVGPGATTYTDTNPGIRIYEVPPRGSHGSAAAPCRRAHDAGTPG
jgi:hypothetical protein